MSIADKLITIAQNQEKVHHAGQLSVIKGNENLKGAASGTTVAINDASSVQHDVKISVSSKNMLDAPNLVFHNNDVAADFKVEGNSFTIRGMKGTSTNHVSSGQLSFPTISTNSTVYPVNIVTHGIPVIENKTYTISFDYLLLELGEWENNSVQFIVYYSDLSTPLVKNDQVLGEIDVVKHYSFVFNSKKTDKIGINFRLNNNYVTISNIQIKEGSIDTPFTPYLADTSTIGVKRYGKNLFNPSYYPKYDKYGITIEYLSDEDCFLLNGTFTGSTSHAYKLKFDNYILGSIGEYYTVSAICMGGSINIPSGYARPYFGVAESLTDTSSTNWLDSVNMNNTIATRSLPLTQQYISHFWFIISNGINFENYKVKIQLEKGRTATDYEPYKEPVDMINGVVKSQPNFILISDNVGARINAEYIKDIDKAYNELVNQIALSGGE